MNTWHTTDEELTVYRYGAANRISTASIEAHLLACPRCRASLAGVGGDTSAADTARRWDQLVDRLDTPRSSALSRITVSTRPLLAAWLLAMLLVVLLPVIPVLVIGLAVPTMLLAMAPLAPIAAVALAYRSSSDPAGELAGATPMAGLRTVTTRALAVSCAAAPVGILVGLLLQVPFTISIAWLVPGLALSSLVLLSGTTRVDPTIVAAALAVAWPVAVALPSTTRRVSADLIANTIAAPEVQLSMVAIAALALAAAAARRDHVSYRRTL